LNSATIRSSAYGGQVWADSLDEPSLHWRISIIEGSLNDVVGEGITKKMIELAGLKHFLNKHVLRRFLSASKALLNDIRAKFLFR
jgi:hypothetical protein